MEMIFMNIENTETSESQKFILNLSQKLDFLHVEKYNKTV